MNLMPFHSKCYICYITVIYMLYMLYNRYKCYITLYCPSLVITYFRNFWVALP